MGEKVDVVAVSFHWGISSSHETADYQKTVGKAAIDAGADIVMGHHPHLVQGIEVWKERPIFYSTGNFAFDWEKMRGRNLDGILLRCLVKDGSLSRVSFVPARRNDGNDIELHDPAADTGRAIVSKLEELSKQYGTRLTVQGAEVVVGIR